MENNTTPGIMPNSPVGGTVLASLKRNVLWGVLGLVALVFTTVCVMYYTSRQSEAATTTEGTPTEASIAPIDGTTGTGTDTGTDASAPAPLPTVTTTTPPAAATAPAVSAAPAPKDVLPKAAAPVTTAKPAAKPAEKSTEKSAAKPATTTTKTLDANNIPHGTKIYVVKSGDTMEKIARQVYGDGHRVSRLVELNKDWLKDVNHLKVGQKLLVERTMNPRDYADY